MIFTCHYHLYSGPPSPPFFFFLNSFLKLLDIILIVIFTWHYHLCSEPPLTCLPPLLKNSFELFFQSLIVIYTCHYYLFSESVRMDLILAFSCLLCPGPWRGCICVCQGASSALALGGFVYPGPWEDSVFGIVFIACHLNHHQSC